MRTRLLLTLFATAAAGMKVPRAGSAYRFVRPLVVDEETKLTFNYRNK